MDNYSFCCSAEIDLNNRCCECGEEQKIVWGRENQNLNKISTCVLESMNITYGGDRFKTFDGNEDGAPPVETTMTLNFKEMELITKQRAEEGF